MKGLKDMNIEKMMDCEMLIKVEKGKVETRVKGYHWGVKAALATLIGSLKEESTLSDEDIRESVEDGLKSDEEFKDDIIKKLDSMLKKLENAIKED